MRITIFAVAICGLLTSMTSIAVGYKVVNTNPTFDKLSYLDSDSEFVIPSVNSTDFEEKALILGDRLVFTAVDANGSRELYSYSNLDKNVKKLSASNTTGLINGLRRIGKNKAVFTAEKGLFETDGTIVNTKKIFTDEFVKSTRIISVNNIIRVDADGIVHQNVNEIVKRQVSGEETVIYSGVNSTYGIARIGRYSVTQQRDAQISAEGFIDSVVTDGTIENTHEVSMKKIKSPDRLKRNVTYNYNENSMFFLSEIGSDIVFSKLTDDGIENILSLNGDIACGAKKSDMVTFFSFSNIFENEHSYYISSDDGNDLMESRTFKKNSCVVVIGKQSKKIEKIINYNKNSYVYADFIGFNSAGELIAVVDQWQNGDYSSYGTRFEKNNILIFDPRTEMSRFIFESDYRTFESLYVSDSNFMFNLVDFNSPMVDSEKWRTSTYKLNLDNLKLTKVSGNSNNFDQYGRPAGFVLVDKTEDLAQFYEINGNVISIGYFPFFGMYSFTDKVNLIRLDSRYYRDGGSDTSEYNYFPVSNGWVFNDRKNNKIGHINFRGELTYIDFPVKCGGECGFYFNGVIGDGSYYYVKIDVNDESLLFRLNQENTAPVDKIRLANEFLNLNLNSVIDANPVIDGKYLKTAIGFYDFKAGTFVEPQYQCGNSTLFAKYIDHNQHVKIISQQGSELFSSESVSYIEFSSKTLGKVLISYTDENYEFKLSLLDCNDGNLSVIPEDKSPFVDLSRNIAFNKYDGKYYYFANSMLYSLNVMTGNIDLVYDATLIPFPYGIQNLAFVGETVLFWSEQLSPMDEYKVYYIKAGSFGEIYINDGVTHQLSLVKGQYNADERYIYGYYRRASTQFDSGSQNEFFIFDNETLKVKFLDMFPDSSRSDISTPKFSSGRVMYNGSAPGFLDEFILIDPVCSFYERCDWVNSPPNVDMNLTLYYAAGDHFYIPVRAIDSDFDKLTFSLEDKPNWMSVTADGNIKGVIPDNAKATNPITIIVDDGINRVSQTFSLNIVDANVNDGGTKPPPIVPSEPPTTEDSSGGGGGVDIAFLSALLLLLLLREFFYFRKIKF